MTSTASPKPALIRLPSRTPRRRLFCLPFAGGGVSGYRPWLQALPPDIELVAAQLPGRESRLREAPYDSIWEMADALLPEILEMSDLPYALFGHSMGGLVAYELAVAIERMRVPAPTHVFISARRPPDEPADQPLIGNAPDAEFLDVMQRRYNAIPDAIKSEPDLLELLLPTLRADLRAIESYTPRTLHRLRTPVHVFGGVDDRHPFPNQLAGWQRVVEQPIRVRLFPGDHFFITSQRDAVMNDIAATWTLDPDRQGSGA
ncbi:MAG TPA: alpha/beta fold hydrolase [Gemmatimonadaceae bacterium]|jgi:surfactin synthase thioesterase subunit